MEWTPTIIALVATAAAVTVTGIVLLSLWLTGVLWSSDDEEDAGLATPCTATDFTYKAKHDNSATAGEAGVWVSGYSNIVGWFHGTYVPTGSTTGTTTGANHITLFDMNTTAETATTSRLNLPVKATHAWIGTPACMTSGATVALATDEEHEALLPRLDYVSSTSIFEVLDLYDRTKRQEISKTSYSARMCFYDATEDELVLVWNKTDNTEVLIETHKRDGEYKFATTASTSKTLADDLYLQPYTGTLAGKTLMLSQPVVPQGRKLVQLERGGSGWIGQVKFNADTPFQNGWSVAISRSGLRMAVGSPIQETHGGVHYFTRSEEGDDFAFERTLLAPNDLVTETLTEAKAVGYGGAVTFVEEKILVTNNSKPAFIDPENNFAVTYVTLNDVTGINTIGDVGTHINGARNSTLITNLSDPKQVQYWTKCTV